MRRLLPTLALLLLALPVAAQPEAALQQARFDVAYLAADLLEGRAPGTTGEALAAAYIAGRFAELGLTPGGADGGWTQPFSYQVSTNPHGAGGESQALHAQNVVGWLDNGAATTVVVGAHYDHLGYGGAGSRRPGETTIHNGADDNASGVAALLAIAERLAQSAARQNNYMFVAFSAEEAGLHGSKQFLDHTPVPVEAINYMINLDMVGRLNDTRTLAVNGTGTSPAWADVLDAAAAATDLRLARHDSGLGPSDHASFYLRDLPVLHLFTGQHEDYHTPTDDSHRIVYDGLLDVSRFATHLIESLDGTGRLPFTATKDEQQNRSMAFKVGLGVMPDYVFDGEGLRVDAVLADRAGEHAGLKRGDIILRIGDHAIADVYAYMEALGTFDQGDATTLLVQRGNERLTLTVQF